MKQPFELAVDKFLENWEHKKDVVGAIICGSYVTGNPSKHSDIDLHIILDKKVKWRQRGNKIIDGFLIEYFSNPMPQNLKYLEDDFKKNRNYDVHMFTTGRVLFDKTGDLKAIIKKAKELSKKKFPKPNNLSIELNKYAIWDMLDNLEEVYDANGEEFYSVYYNFLNSIFDDYANFLRFVSIPINKKRRFLVNEKDRKKYHVAYFPDKTFSNLYVQAIKLSNKTEMMNIFKKIVNHVHKKMGGFNVDGWKLKSEVKV